MEVAVPTSHRFTLTGAPREPVFDRSGGMSDWWDVGPEGRVVVVRGDPRTTRQVQLVVNWFDDRRRGSGERLNNPNLSVNR